MGGSIGFTIREKNGQEHRVCRWTNQMTYFIDDYKFFDEDKEHFSNYLESWKSMRDDYLASKKNKQPCKLNMSDVYAPYPYLAPMGYGLVVVDYQTKKILSMQSYRFFGKIDCLELSNALEHPKWKDSIYSIDNFEKLFDSGRIKKVVGFTSDNKKTTIDITNFSKQKIFDVMQTKQFEENQKVDDIEWFRFCIEPDPWQIIKFEESQSGLEAFKKEIHELGFSLSKREEKMWASFSKVFK